MYAQSTEKITVNGLDGTRPRRRYGRRTIMLLTNLITTVNSSSRSELPNVWLIYSLLIACLSVAHRNISAFANIPDQELYIFPAGKGKNTTLGTWRNY